MRRGGGISTRPMALLSALLGGCWLAETRAMALSAVRVCESCDVPPARDIPFCAEFIGYSSCRTSSTWVEMDTDARSEYDSIWNVSSSSNTSLDQCASVLKRVECEKIFNVCELGTPQTLCLDSCTEAVATNCSSEFSSATISILSVEFCGSEDSPLVGVSDTGKCFDIDYVGPKHTAWIIGFVIAVVFSFFASVGINLQKKALKQNELHAHENNVEPTPAYKLPLWGLGFFMIFAGSVLDFVAFGLAPQSLLAPLAALTLVWNMMLAPCFNKEKLSRKDIGATLVIFIGATIAVVFASHTSPSYNLSMLMDLYRDPLTCVYFVFIAIVVAAHFAMIQFVEKLSLTSRRHRMIQVGAPAVWSRARLVAYSGLSGTMGGQSVLFAKSSAELLKAAFHGDNCFVHFETYLIALALIGCLFAQIHYLNCGLMHYDALSVVPIYQAYWIISGVLGGAIYFQEIRSFSVEQALMFLLGICTTIFGVVLLSRRKLPAASTILKRKLERGFSFSAGDTKVDLKAPGSGTHLASVPEDLIAIDATRISADSPDSIGAAVGPMGMILELDRDESSTEGSENEDSEGGDGSGEDQVSRQAIDNYLDMSTTVYLNEILGGLGFQAAQQRGIFTRRQSSRNSGESPTSTAAPPHPRRSMDDIELGLPQATREANPRERLAKRRSITFTTFQNKDPPPPPPPPSDA